MLIHRQRHRAKGSDRGDAREPDGGGSNGDADVILLRLFSTSASRRVNGEQKVAVQHVSVSEGADVNRSLGARHQSGRARRQGKFGTWTAKMLDPHAGVKAARGRPPAQVNYDGAFCCWCGLPATSL
jgi:hypothetical protein